MQRIVAISELWIHIPGCVLSPKLRIFAYPVDRGRRCSGQSKMNFVALARHGFKGLMVFSEELLVRMGVACTIVAAGALVGGIVAVVMKLLGHTSPGCSTLVLGVLLLVFLQMGALTLTMLMLTGRMRASTVATVDFHSFSGQRLIARPASPLGQETVAQ